MRFGVLGPTEVWDGVRLVEPGPARRRLLLAALLVDLGRVVPVETLLDRVWDGRPPESATSTLQTYVSRLRATLASATESAPATVTTSPRGYALDVADDDLDARRFEALLGRAGRRRDDGDPAGARALVGEALGLWRGEAYADFATDFTSLEAARLHDLRVSAHHLAAELDLALGRHVEAVRLLQPWVAAEPLREPLRAALMLALYRSGRSAEALQVYADGRELLADQLGADPDVASQQLHARILRQDPTLDLAPPPEPARVASPVAAPSPLPAAGGERLVGRTEELARLTRALERANAGTTAFVAVVGEAGIGKSRLVEELSGRARAAGQLVAWGRCWQHEGAPLLWPWVQVLRELGPRVPDDVLAAATTGRAAPVTTLVPELVHTATTPAPATTTSLDEVEVSVFDAVVTFLGVVARHQPLLLVLDDLQWADPASRRLAEYVATHLRTEPVTVVVTVRSPGLDDDHPDLEVLAALARITRVERVDLPPISATDVHDLVRDRIGDDVDEPTVAALHARTGGNPFYIGEIVRLVLTTGVDTAMADGVPDSVRGVIRSRVQRLPESDQAVLRAAAVLGRTFDIELVAAVTGIDGDTVDEAVDRAIDLGLLRSEPGTADLLRFTHALLQETLFDETGPSRRRRLHRRTADVLVERREGVRRGPVSTRWIAYHLAEAGSDEDLERAAEFYLLANDEALERRTYTESSELLHRALETADRVPGGRGVTLRAAATYRLRSFHMLFDGTLSPYGRWAEGPVEFDPDAPTRDLLTTLHAWWGDLHGRNDMIAAAEVSAVLARLAQDRDDDLLRLGALMTSGYNLLQEGRFRDAHDAFGAMEALYDRVEIPELVFTPDPRVGGPLFQGICALHLGDLERDDELFRLADHRAHALGDPVAQSYVDGMGVFRQFWRRDGPAARAASEVVERNIQARNMHMMRIYMAIPTAWALADVDLAAGTELADREMVTVGEPASVVWRPTFLAMYAEILLRAGRLDDAAAAVDRAFAEAATSGAHAADATLHRIRAQVLRAGGAPAAAVDAELETGLAVARAQEAALFVRQLDAERVGARVEADRR
ncbi:BTAD domain-containing putative transcriptional regulator [Jatrophihabitans sp. YIM 134969]